MSLDLPTHRGAALLYLLGQSPGLAAAASCAGSKAALDALLRRDWIRPAKAAGRFEVTPAGLDALHRYRLDCLDLAREHTCAWPGCGRRVRRRGGYCAGHGTAARRRRPSLGGECGQEC